MYHDCLAKELTENVDIAMVLGIENAGSKIPEVPDKILASVGSKLSASRLLGRVWRHVNEIELEFEALPLN